MKTAIRNGVVIGWVEGQHRVLTDSEVVFEDNEIIFVGDSREVEDAVGAVDTVIDASGRIVMPGFVNCHLHVTDTLYTKGQLEETLRKLPDGIPSNFDSLYRVLPTVREATDGEAQVMAARVAFAELARTGSTTVVELGYDFEIGGNANIKWTEQVAEVAGESGLRCYSGPRFRTQYYRDDGNFNVVYKDYGEKGQKRFEDCVQFCQDWNGKYDDRLRTLLAPGQIDTCSPVLLKETRRYADMFGIPIQIHAGQSQNEYRVVGKKEGMTTVEYMMETGLLGPDFIIGHGQIMTKDGNHLSLGKHEIEALRDSQTTICHLPWVKARRGGVINSIQKYWDMGISQCLGTDTFPFDMFNEMKMASVACKIVEQSADAALSKDVFHMATVGGADALGRPDLGRLAPGCKADIVTVRIDTTKATPIYDPFRFLVLTGSGEDVDKVFVDGNLIVDEGKVLTIDVKSAIDEVNKASKRVWKNL